ncbi:Zinc finger RING/FYVE/PHD-type protein [Dioscorea alata]|uniref:Zinc finger RING/FYVE/PHD-type protein n=1 Tax=Dioscorea alata TaxID=55571 RepID=A0ACB7V8M5_DIOAL|nr:Zinc finger RING/FYVE/PHD-type protein [Dioscorea alata]
MGSTWRKARRALRLNLCLYVPRTLDDDASPFDFPCASPNPGDSTQIAVPMPNTPIPTSSGLRLPKSSRRSSKRTCAICLGSMKAGQGHALFTAECSHTFHFHCITSNVSHGNHVCPICRAKWKEIPFQVLSL